MQTFGCKNLAGKNWREKKWREKYLAEKYLAGKFGGKNIWRENGKTL